MLYKEVSVVLLRCIRTYDGCLVSWCFRLRYSAKGFLTVAGFSKPTDADADDIQLWMPLGSRSDPPSLTTCQAKYILSNIKDSFLTLFDLETEAASMAPFQGRLLCYFWSSLWCNILTMILIIKTILIMIKYKLIGACSQP